MSEAAARATGPQLLLAALRATPTLDRLDLPAWERLLACARRNRVLSYLAYRVEMAGRLGALPAAAQAALQDARTSSRRLAQLGGFELRQLTRVLDRAQVPVMALKGMAYVLRGMPHADTRLLSDVDVMVPAERLRDAEAALLAAGYRTTKLDAYDQRYYREWSHELPPMQFPGRLIGVDVHHTIVPPVSRLKPDREALWRASRALPGTSVRVLGEADAFLHAAVHLFFDSDFDGRFRDLVDLHEMVVAWGTAAWWGEVLERAILLGLGRPLHYALGNLATLLGSPIPAEVLAASRRFRAPAPVDALTRRMMASVLAPVDPAVWPPRHRGQRFLLYVRSHWLRMPPHLLIPHLVRKGLRRGERGDAAA